MSGASTYQTSESTVTAVRQLPTMVRAAPVLCTCDAPQNRESRTGTDDRPEGTNITGHPTPRVALVEQLLLR